MLLLLLLGALLAQAADLPAGRIVDRVQCSADASQTYALYLPSRYSDARAWPVIVAFDPAAHGRTPVERYRQAAEKYGYIVAGSNNSRNGPWAASASAARAMLDDVFTRFRIDERRVYTAGMSGGARVAMGVALGSKGIAGVIASSAGFPDSVPRKSVPFVIFGTAGTEDFNLMEMRRVDRTLTTPHRLAVFEGGHMWLPVETATQAVEWMEVQAAKSGRSVEPGRIDEIYGRRVAAVEALAGDQDRYTALEELAADFDGLKDVSSFAARAAALGRDKRVRESSKRDRDEELHEQREIEHILECERQLATSEQRVEALAELRSTWKRLSATAGAEADSRDRRLARRVLRGLAMGVAERVRDPEYRKLVAELRPAR